MNPYIAVSEPVANFLGENISASRILTWKSQKIVLVQRAKRRLVGK